MNYNILLKLFLFILLCNSCNDINTTKNQLKSSNYKAAIERVEILKKEINYPSDFSDAEFDLFNVNGFSFNRPSLPGASSLKYQFIVKITPENIHQWLDGYSEIRSDERLIKRVKNLINHRKGNWITYSKPKFYSRDNSDSSILILYKNESIIFKYVTLH